MRLKKYQQAELNYKARNDLAFNPCFDFDTGVEKTISWMRNNGQIKTRPKLKKLSRINLVRALLFLISPS